MDVVKERRVVTAESFAEACVLAAPGGQRPLGMTRTFAERGPIPEGKCRARSNMVCYSHGTMMKPGTVMRRAEQRGWKPEHETHEKVKDDHVSEAFAALPG